jgi:hypothetical protein
MHSAIRSRRDRPITSRRASRRPKTWADQAHRERSDPTGQARRRPDHGGQGVSAATAQAIAAAALGLATGNPQATAVVVALAAFAGWTRLPKRRRLKVRRWVWRQTKRPFRWAWTEVTRPRPPVARPAPARHRPPPPTVEDEPMWLYRLWDGPDCTGRLLYIGITASRRLGQRWWEHAADKPWIGDVQCFRVDPTTYPNRLAARIAEALAIEAEKPLHNKSRPDPAHIGGA